MGFVRYNKSNIPCKCGYPDGMSPLEKMVFPRAPPSGKPSSLGKTFHHDTHTGMAYLYNVMLSFRLFACLFVRLLVCWLICLFVWSFNFPSNSVTQENNQDEKLQKSPFIPQYSVQLQRKYRQPLSLPHIYKATTPTH